MKALMKSTIERDYSSKYSRGLLERITAEVALQHLSVLLPLFQLYPWMLRKP